MATADQNAAVGDLVRPPVLFLASLLLGHGLEHLTTWQPFTLRGPAEMWWTVGGSCTLIGLALVAAGIRNFARAGTPYRSNQPVRELVTTGVHGWSRNPIYVGLFLVYWGIATACRSPWSLILTLPLAVFVRYGIIAREEAYLERRFGQSYRDYKARVRRWL
ncbi:MAG: isoprenylcysteine carboxylmethyltransferase family protein [Armatimonadetes bacterium]|nr:isoprenylcysteine carboxylmethyltransferase family protein [Armatimonadota bacterium]